MLGQNCPKFASKVLQAFLSEGLTGFKRKLLVVVGVLDSNGSSSLGRKCMELMHLHSNKVIEVMDPLLEFEAHRFSNQRSLDIFPGTKCASQQELSAVA